MADSPIGGLYVPFGLDTSDFDKKLPAVNKQLDEAGKVISGKVKFALQNLSFQLNDIGTSLASGGSPFRILAQQAGQVIQAFQQGGGFSAVMGAAKEKIGALVTPTRLAIGGLAALGVGFGVLLSRASTNAEQLRQFDLILKGFGNTGQASARGLQAVSKQLQDMGLSAEEADSSVKAIGRSTVLNPSQASRIATTGADLGARLGIGTVEGIKTYTTALEGGAEAMIKVGLAANALTVPQATQLEWMRRNGQEAQALKLAYEAIEKNLSGEFKDSLSKSQEAVLSMSSAWNRMLDALAKTGPIQTARDALIGLMQAITSGLSLNPKGTVMEQGWEDLKNSPAGKFITRWGTLSEADRKEHEAVTGPDAPSSSGAASSRFSLGPLSANTDSLQRLTTVMEAAANALPAGYRVAATSTKRGGAGGSLHDTGDAIDVQIIGPDGKALPNKGKIGSDAGMYRDLAIAAYKANKEKYPGSSLTWGAEFETSKGSGMADWMHFDTGPHRGGLGPSLAEIAGDPAGKGDLTKTPAQKIIDANVALKELIKTEGEATAIAKLRAIDQQALAAATAERNKAMSEGRTVQEAETRAQIAGSEARKRGIIELEKEASLYNTRVAGINRVTDALKSGEAAAMRQAAIEDARVQAIQTGGNADAIAARSLAEKIALKKQDLQGTINDNQRSVDLVRLEDSLQGTVAEKITYQLDLLRAKQTLEKSGISVTDEMAQSYLKSADNLAKANLELAQHNRELEQWKALGSTIEGSFSNIFDTIADGTFKVSSAIKTLLKDLGRFLTSSAMRALFYGEESGGVGGGLFAPLKGAFGTGGLFGSQGSLFGNAADASIAAGGPPLAMANGGSFSVGGSGAIDSKLVSFRATPGELVNVRKPGQSGGGGGEVIHISLNPSEGWVAGVADRQIHTRSGAIVRVAVRQSQQLTRRAFSTMAGESQARQA